MTLVLTNTTTDAPVSRTSWGQSTPSACLVGLMLNPQYPPSLRHFFPPDRKLRIRWVALSGPWKGAKTE